MADLIARIPEFTTAESELVAVQTRLMALEAKARENTKLVETLQGLDPISEDSIAVNLKEVQSSMSEVEADSQMSALGQRLAIKVTATQTCEVTCKDLVVQQIKETAAKVAAVRAEFIAMIKDMHLRMTAETATMTVHVEEISAASHRDRELLTTAIDDMQVLDRGKAGGKNWLQEELCSAVDSAITDLQGVLEFRLKQLELTFKQEHLGLRNQFESLKARALQLDPQADVDGAELARLGSEARAALAKVEKYSDANTASLKEVVDSITDSLLATSTDLQSYLQAYRRARPAEQLSFASTRKSGFEEKLSGVKFQIDMLRKNVEAVETSTNSELFKIEECSQAAAAGSSQYADLLPLLATVKARLPQNTQTLKTDVETLSQRLVGLWTQANQEGGLKIPLPNGVSAKQKDGVETLISLLDTPESSKPFKPSQLS